MGMKKVAVVVAPGFEEGETLTIVDIMRRAHIQCDMFGFNKVVQGEHDIEVQCDDVLGERVLDYDMIVLTGGYGGAGSIILEHIDEMQNIGIQDLAKRCYVAMSSIFCFCKEIGLKDFAELKDLLADPHFYFEEQSQSDSLQGRVRDYEEKIYMNIKE